jgi:putative ABC transport system permease protein
VVAAGSAGTLLALAAVVVGLGAAAGAPARGRSLAALRTMGLTGAQARAVSLGELLPPVLGAAVVGSGLGAVVAALVRAPLELELLTGQFGAPALVVPWAAPLVAVPLVLVVLVVVGVESSLRRRERLGQVLRVG